MLSNVNNRMQQQKRQIQGKKFDLDALTDLYSEIHLGISPDERMYLSQRKKDKILTFPIALIQSMAKLYDKIRHL